MSVDAHYRRLKEYLIDNLDQVQKSKEDGQTLFFITYFAAFLKYAYGYFSETVNKPFNFIKVLRIYNPITPNLIEYLLNFLKYIKLTNKLMEFIVLITVFSLFLDSYLLKAYSKYYPAIKLSHTNFDIVFKLKTIFNIIYKDVFYQVSKA